MSLQTSQPQTSNPADDAAIRALYQRQMDEWNRGDGMLLLLRTTRMPISSGVIVRTKE